MENYIKWGFESRLKQVINYFDILFHYIKWGFESRLKLLFLDYLHPNYYIKWGFESRLKEENLTFDRKVRLKFLQKYKTTIK